jgi:predicted aspartyl protease
VTVLEEELSRDIRTRVRMWNFLDEGLAQRGIITPEAVRSVELAGAVVDTGSTRLVFTQELVDRLGLSPDGEIAVRYADSRVARKRLARGVAVEIMGRVGTFDAVVEERGEPLIGMEVLEGLDLWPDPQRGLLTTNPASPDIPLYNLLRSETCPLP